MSEEAASQAPAGLEIQVTRNGLRFGDLAPEYPARPPRLKSASKSELRAYIKRLEGSLAYHQILDTVRKRGGS
jgi:hypothetical protein